MLVVDEEVLEVLQLENIDKSFGVFRQGGYGRAICSVADMWFTPIGAFGAHDAVAKLLGQLRLSEHEDTCLLYQFDTLSTDTLGRFAFAGFPFVRLG